MKTTRQWSVAYLVQRPYRSVLAAVGVLVFSVTLWRGYDILIGANLGTIAPGQAYRSAQLTGPGFRAAINTMGLRSVINLRGENPEAEWYREEVAACRAAGIQHYDIEMSARQLPSPNVVEQLLNALRTAPRPLLIHCKNGADRTGLASALWLISFQGTPPAAAAQELTIWHGHMPIGATTAMDRFFELYVQTGQGMDLEQWVRQKYPMEYTRQTHSPTNTLGE